MRGIMIWVVAIMRGIAHVLLVLSLIGAVLLIVWLLGLWCGDLGACIG